MKDLIRKILHESLEDKSPNRVEKFKSLTREERIEFIKNNKKRIESLVPMIKEYFISKFGDSLMTLVIDKKNSHFGNENFSMEQFILKFYFKHVGNDKILVQFKREIFNDMSSFFDIDVHKYGVPLEIAVYEMTWRQV